jgi:hypothetical protein
MKRVVLGLVLAAMGVREAAAQGGGCRGYLDLRPGAGGKTPPNAGLVFAGYTFERPTAKATSGGKDIAVEVEEWPSSGARCGVRYVLVRPAGSAWPAGAKVDVDLGTYGKHSADIGAEADRTAPKAAKLGPARKQGPSPDGRVVSYAGVMDDESPVVLLRVAWADRPETGSERATIEPDAAGQFLYFVGSKGCAALVLVDAAGNEQRFPEMCRP